ncbi:MAG: Adenylosuccinate synthetase [Chloroflexi bacterium]|nr:Adenylosuccinate synthetase [Chloroflexota bacterium]
MTLNMVIGAQWGDEGKGRVVDLLAAEADFVARYSGGDNAGHTVTVGEQTFKLHLIPSGVIQPHTVGLLGNGMVINPIVLLEEMEKLRQAGVVINPERVRISYAAHVITPGHLALDKAREMARGDEKIGTTQRGIGPAYNDKTARGGIRMETVLSQETFADAIEANIEKVNRQLTSLYGTPPLDAHAVAQEYAGYARTLAPYVGDVSGMLAEALESDQSVLAEGAQGTLLDLDHGTYPFVTSSTPTAPGVLVGLGVGVGKVGRVLGVTKAFQTRVGEGPFPTEVFGDAAIRLRGTGENPWDEFGTTTGRPRRVGWLDGVLLRYAARVNGLTELVITKLDILSALDPLRICTGYRVNGDRLENLPLGPSDLSPFEPVYEELPGWEEDIMGVQAWENLPPQARAYIQRIEELVGLPVNLISVGPERDQIVQR